MRRATTYLSLALVAPLISSCSAYDPSSVYDVDLSTTSLVYENAKDLGLNVTNRSEPTVHLMCGGQVFLEEMSGNDVAARWMIQGFAHCGIMQGISTGSSAEFAFDLSGPIFDGQIVDARFDETVQYRFYVDLYGDRPTFEDLEDHVRRSNHFMILNR